MSKFKRVLSDDDITELYLRSDMYGGEIYFRSLVAEIEQAVLEKQAEQQEPAVNEWCWRMDWLRHNGFNPSDPFLWERSGQAYEKQMRGRTSPMI